ncbi:MAG: carbohydrate-binding domain-containing protein, partial [Treponema sp.]|nr:carbohydrate-binding domain-containing protein [Treponema sp.]
MKKSKSMMFWGILITAALVWTSCPNPTADDSKNNGNQGNQSGTEQGGDGTSNTVGADPGDTADGALVPASQDVNALGLSNPVLIVFSEADAPAVTEGANATVSADTNHVTVTLTGAGADVVAQGVSADASIAFSGNYDFNLYLNGVGLASEDGAAVNNDGKGTMNVTLVEGTANRLIDGTGGDQKAAFYSKGDFTVGGSGSLEVRGR